jgi:non-specific serine/threonine protein kinase
MLLANRFEVTDLIGSGGMGDVHAAMDHRDNRVVAVKRLRASLADNPDAVAAIAREGALLRAASHPNIVSVIAVLEESDGPWIVMDYVGGGTLQELLERSGPLPLERALSIGLDLADALARAHRLGIVHRDLKPANVLMAEDGTPRLADFGVARMLSGPATGGGAIVGTLPYLPPEAWDGEPVDARADIWALGVMLYEMLAGRRPFVAAHPGLLHAAISLKEPTPLAELRPDVPPPVARAVNAMLVKRPNERMATVREIALVLERALRAMSHGAAADASAMRGLPRPASALLGRAKELALIEEHLDAGDRLITLFGPGGSGKTRLAIAAAEQLARRGFEIVFIDLTAVTDPSLVMTSIARALDVEDDLERSLDELVVRQLEDRRIVLVLDNFEQVIDAAPSLVRIVRATEHAALLVTSRFLLRMAAERGIDVEPFTPPPATAKTARELRDNTAVALFVERAIAAQPRFELTDENAADVATICRRLDGLPLAIELAAARSRALPPAELARQLEEPLAVLTSSSRDRAPHQRTLRRTIEWSVRLLDVHERALFVALSVFAGGWSLDDAHAVLGGAADEDSRAAIIDGLQSLIEKSLVVPPRGRGEARYRLLETVRELARELLAADPDAEEFPRRHARHFASVAEEEGRGLVTARQRSSLDTLRRSHENFRAALAWAAREDSSLFVRLCASLGRFWYLAGHWTEAIQWHERALVCDGGTDADRAIVLDELGRLEMFLGRERQARDHHEAAHAAAMTLPDSALRSRTAEGLGEVLLKVGDVDRALVVLTEAVADAREAHDETLLTDALTTLGTSYVGAGDHVRAESLLREALDVGERVSNPLALTRIRYYLAGLALLRDDHRAARAHADAGRAAAAESDDTSWQAHFDEMLGRVALHESSATAPEALLRRSAQSFYDVGSRSCLPHSLEAAARLQLSRFDDDRTLASEAARFLGAAHALCNRLGIAMLPVERALFNQTLVRARTALSPEEFESAWESGVVADEAVVVQSILDSRAGS